MTVVPTGPVVGVNEDITGGTVTMNEVAEYAVRPFTVTEIVPVMAPEGTMAVS